MKVNDLVNKAKFGKVTAKEVDWLFQRYQEDDDILYDFILVSGLAKAYKYEDFIKDHLTFSQDPMVSGLSLKVLCVYWDKSDIYSEFIYDAISGYEWDEEHNVYLAALRSLSYLYKKSKSTRPLRVLLDELFNVDNDYIDQSAAYQAICEIFNKEAPSSIGFDIHQSIDVDLINLARRTAEI